MDDALHYSQCKHNTDETSECNGIKPIPIAIPNPAIAQSDAAVVNPVTDCFCNNDRTRPKSRRH